MLTMIKDDDPVSQDLLDKEDKKTKEAKRKYGQEHKTTCFHEDILCDKEDNGHN